MTLTEFMLCVAAVCCSSASQLCVKGASKRVHTLPGVLLLGAGGGLMFVSMLIAVWVLRTLQLSQLVPFAAGAYILVPLGGVAFFGEKVNKSFWFGVSVILLGVLLTLF